MKQNDEELLDVIRAQSKLMSQAEVLALLAHDLGHRAIRVTESVKLLIETTKKSLREKRSPESIAPVADEARRACEDMERLIGMIRRARFAQDDAIVRFQVAECVKEAVQTLGAVLESGNMAVEVQIPPTVEVYGVPSVLRQIFLNLILNSLDAQMSVRKRRKNTVHIACTETDAPHRHATIRFWDEGPGISLTAFPNPSDIFIVGRSSRQNKTGTGLPVARSLLEKVFRGEINVKDPTSALFEIVIPLEKPEYDRKES